MAKVQLKVPPWITSLLNKKSADWFVLEREIEEGATIGDLLADLTASYDGFRKVVFNPDVGTVSDQVLVFLNDNLLPDPDLAEARLKDGDSIMLLHVYTGG